VSGSNTIDRDRAFSALGYAPRCPCYGADPNDQIQRHRIILRTGALFPAYRTFSLLEQLKGRVIVPTVLFYPGELDGPAGLRFMGVLDAEHNYRPKISDGMTP
jgi:hypothetical protein